MDIGYSYAYKTDCAGDRYIKAEEVKYLLKCERGKAIDDFADKLLSQQIVDKSVVRRVKEQLKAGGDNEQG